jgi:hypothetical protein
MPVPPQTLLVAQCLGQRLAERDADILDRVVRVDMQVAVAWISRSIRPWREICSSMWSRKGTPVAKLPLPLPSRFRRTVIRVSSVFLETSACRIGIPLQSGMSGLGKGFGLLLRPLR